MPTDRTEVRTMGKARDEVREQDRVHLVRLLSDLLGSELKHQNQPNGDCPLLAG
jgi:hypothetical protein